MLGTSKQERCLPMLLPLHAGALCALQQLRFITGHVLAAITAAGKLACSSRNRYCVLATSSLPVHK